jgi:hypothetical protein
MAPSRHVVGLPMISLLAAAHGQLARAQAAVSWTRLGHCAHRPPTDAARTSECLDSATGRLRLADPRSVPLFVRWEDYAGGWLPREIRGLVSVQIGANCGSNTASCAVGGDPVFEYVRACSWKGIAIEPSSKTFEKLCHTYADIPLVAPRRGAVTSPSRVHSPLFMANRPIETNRLSNLTIGRRVPLTSLAALWEQEVRPMTEVVHVLVIDAEGSEPYILCCNIPSPKPMMILFEHVHLKQEERDAIGQNLERQGYVHVADLKHQGSRSARLGLPQDRLYGLRGAANASRAMA